MTFNNYYEKLQNSGNDRSREEERVPHVFSAPISRTYFPHLFPALIFRTYFSHLFPALIPRTYFSGVGGYIYIYIYIYIYQSPKLSLFKWVERSDTKFGALATRLLNLGQLVKTIKPGLKYALYLV